MPPPDTPLPPDLLPALMGAGPLLALIDRQDRVVWVNDAFERAFVRGLPLPVTFADLVRHGFAGGFGVRIDSGDIEQFLQLIKSRRRSANYRAFATDLMDGRWIWMVETVTDDGNMMLVASDITSLKAHENLLAQAHRTALEASLTDELTQASNRRHILALCREAMAQQSGPEGGIWVVIMDLDNFKAINDRYGHDGGDAVLRHFVSHCQAGLRPGDRLGRLGGEEFMLLLPSGTSASTEMVVNRLRASLTPCGSIPYNFSAGIAQANLGETIESVIGRADVALYQAKRSGRACNAVASTC